MRQSCHLELTHWDPVMCKCKSSYKLITFQCVILWSLCQCHVCWCLVSFHLYISRPRWNWHHFADIFKCFFSNENVLNVVPKFQINNFPALAQVMARRRTSDKPLSETMMVSLLMHICIPRPQWVMAISSHDTDKSLECACLPWVNFNNVDSFNIEKKNVKYENMFVFLENASA